MSAKSQDMASLPAGVVGETSPSVPVVVLAVVRGQVGSSREAVVECVAGAHGSVR